MKEEYSKEETKHLIGMFGDISIVLEVRGGVREEAEQTW